MMGVGVMLGIAAEPNGKRSGVYARDTKAEELRSLRARCSGGE